jgi:hypothetical protein
MLPTLREAVALMQGRRSHKWLTTSCILFCIGWLLGACSYATGPDFRPAERLAPGQTMVYLYFPKQSGYSDSYTILGNGATVTRLDEGGYSPFVLRQVA